MTRRRASTDDAAGDGVAPSRSATNDPARPQATGAPRQSKRPASEMPTTRGSFNTAAL